MNSVLMRSAMRSRLTGLPATLAKTSAVRGGFHKPDPLPYKFQVDTKRHRLEDINTVLYSDIGPEFHMHLHSIQIQSGKQGWFLIFAYFSMIIFPCWLVLRHCHKQAGSNLFPCVRPGPDHAHMAPKILGYLKANNFENKPDKFGRKSAYFYKNFFRQETSNEFKPALVIEFNKHGFSY